MFQTIWNLLVLAFSLSYFVGLGAITYKLGISALELHKTGLISLSKLSHSLMGSESLGR